MPDRRHVVDPGSRFAAPACVVAPKLGGRVRMRERGRRHVDYLLIALVVLASLFGLLAIHGSLPHNGASHYVRLQAVWIALGLAVMAIFAVIDYHFWARWARSLYAANLVMLLAVFVVGRHALGAQRWLQLGPVQIQPSEFAKLLIILTLAAQLTPYAGRMNRWPPVLRACLYIALPMLLIAAQPDLGTSLVFLAILVAMLYVAGMPGWRLAGGCIGALGLAVGAIVAHLRWHVPIPMKDYQLKRLLVFLNPQSDPLGSGYHIIQSEIAIGSGELHGLGLTGGSAATNQLSYLPASQTDFIFSVIGHNMGFVGAATVLVLLFLILWRAVRVITHARDPYGTLLAAGVVAMLGFHVIINAGMAMGVMPVTGVPLPFISYGGSALLVDFAGVGLLLSVHLRHRTIQF